MSGEGAWWVGVEESEFDEKYQSQARMKVAQGLLPLPWRLHEELKGRSKTKFY